LLKQFELQPNGAGAAVKFEIFRILMRRLQFSACCEFSGWKDCFIPGLVGLLLSPKARISTQNLTAYLGLRLRNIAFKGLFEIAF
jgi:hypothetical protein